MSELLAATKRSISMNTYPGYPTERLVLQDVDDLTLPDGPWSTGVHIPPPLERQQQLVEEGYELDALGRPLHPWLREMISDPNVGVVTGLGEYWHWGPNRTADPIIINDDETPKILLIQRSDTGTWALPGGFIDDNEEATVAAKRELLEEAGLLLVGDTGTEIYNGVVADTRTTAHAWAETTALLWRINGTPELRAGDDARDAEWFAIDELPEALHGSHAVLIERAIDALEHTDKAHHFVPLPETITSYDLVDGGHMTYHRITARTASGKHIFMKSHDKHAFTDPTREAHSRQYLHKEKRMYEHIKSVDPTLVPETTEIIEDSTLMLDALLDQDGWHWRLPAQHARQYITTTLDALDTLGTIAPPDDFHDTILPTFETHMKEGWLDLDATTTQKAIRKLHEFKQKMRPEFQSMSEQLMSDIPTLADQAQLLTRPNDLVLAHHDLRQANIAWHPEHGTKLIDWSWAGLGRPGSDATTFLIDLHKSGHDVTEYMEYFNKDHALTMIGFWLAHSTWPTRDNTSSVRFHQALSAVAAYDLLKIGERTQS